ncbi:MAG: hypothetical protein M3O02_03870 [Acidobacteriota bacterium]|nr:hypothetical protein [Acidobacteriota bacterium]
MPRTLEECSEELHALLTLTTNPQFLAHDRDREDLAVLDSLRAQINVLKAQLNYPEILDRYEESDEPGDDYILGAAFEAYRWLYEDDPNAPSARWTGVLATLEQVGLVPA